MVQKTVTKVTYKRNSSKIFQSTDHFLFQDLVAP